MRKQTVSEWLLLHSLPSEIRELNQSRAGFVKVLVFCLNCLLHFISWFARTVQLAVYYCCLGRAIFNAEPLRPTLSLSQHCGSVGYSHFCLLACLLACSAKQLYSSLFRYFHHQAASSFNLS